MRGAARGFRPREGQELQPDDVTKLNYLSSFRPREGQELQQKQLSSINKPLIGFRPREGQELQRGVYGYVIGPAIDVSVPVRGRSCNFDSNVEYEW